MRPRKITRSGTLPLCVSPLCTTDFTDFLNGSAPPATYLDKHVYKKKKKKRKHYLKTNVFTWEMFGSGTAVHERVRV